MKTREKPSGCCLPTAESRSSGANQHAVERATNSNQHPSQMVDLRGGWFQMGSSDGPYPEDGESPVRDVYVDSYQLAATAVSVDAFSEFTDATHYSTLAERLGTSFVFYAHCDPENTYSAPMQAPWWRNVPGACWHSPFGPWRQNSADGDHPVTHIAREDALAYCHWSGTRLPTEAEWESAARGLHNGKPFPWGDILEPQGIPRANVWQGEIPPNQPMTTDCSGTVPVNAYAAEGFGHFNMIGNVWEWVADRFTERHSPRSVRNPRGPLNGSNFVAKGGSYLCHASYCKRYRTSSRQALAPDTTTGNLGFRVAMSASQ